MLIVKAYVNEEPIGRIEVQRTSGDVGEDCTYRIRYPRGFNKTVIKHHYNDGWMQLVSKAIAVIAERGQNA